VRRGSREQLKAGQLQMIPGTGWDLEAAARDPVPDDDSGQRELRSAMRSVAG
jgi:hypothetical protein